MSEKGTLEVTNEQAVEIFTPLAVESQPTPESLPGGEVVTETGVEIGFSATTLGLEATKGGENYKVLGNTVQRLCGAMGSCAADGCGLAESRLSMEERRKEDCAVSNAELAFADKPAFVLTPTEGNNPIKVAFMDEANSSPVSVLDKTGQEVTVFNKVEQASAFVIPESKAKELGGEIFAGMNGADSSFGVATLSYGGERYAVAFASSRPNLGTRPEEFHLLRQSVDEILRRSGVSEDDQEAWQAALAEINETGIDIVSGYSAELENFAHAVRVPDPESDYAKKLAEKNGISPDELTPKMVMEDQYPGSLENGEVHPGSNIGLGILDEPYSDGGCPGDGELCHIDYRGITQRTLEGQLKAVGIDNIRYDDSQAVDPSDQNNMQASNRRMQLANVPAGETLRTMQGDNQLCRKTSRGQRINKDISSVRYNNVRSKTIRSG